MMIYAELLTKPGGDIIEKGIFLSFIELALADKEARSNGQCWSGCLSTNIALCRYRYGQCMYCGCFQGTNHKDGCMEGAIMMPIVVPDNDYILGR